ncbi:MAG: glycosyltransferase [Pseudomonadota bacterium]
MELPISVIIPLASGETAWQKLLPVLLEYPLCEVLLATGAANLAGEMDLQACNRPVRSVKGGAGRAGQMNQAAKTAKGKFLWFLHADSQLQPDTISKLAHQIEQDPDALFYHDLKFQEDGPGLMQLNEWAVRLRSDYLGMPFGDQGFCISRPRFDQLGGYREDVDYGEDHLFAWKARQSGIPLRRTGAAIQTSARKYRDRGWFSTTALHVQLTVAQAWPEYKKLRQIRRADKAAKE